MGSAERTLRVVFDNASEFRDEFVANLANGGVFVATDAPFELREQVDVVLRLEFCELEVVLRGEVVHCVSRQMANIGAELGVAVQFEGSPQTVRAALEPLRRAAGAETEKPPDPGRRRSPRCRARLPVVVRARSREVNGHTRNLSHVGALVAVPASGIAVGTRLGLELTDPSSGETREIPSIVTREVENDGVVAALALEFTPRDGEGGELQRFVEGLLQTEHTRHLGGISGDVAEIGVQNLIQMLANSAPQGTVTLRDGEREGLIGFEGGMIRFVREGSVSGMKALERMLRWTGGSFEFFAQLEPVEVPEPPLPLQAALLQATRLLDEQRGIPSLPVDARPRLSGAPGADEDDLSKTEAAVLDLVRVGFDVGRIVSIIPEPDPEVRRALASLIERGVVTL